MIIQIDTPDDFDFLESINSHGWRALVPFSWDAESGTLERVEKFGSGQVVMLSIRGSAGGIDIGVAGDAPKSEVVHRVRHMLQLDLPMGDFHYFCKQRPKLAHIPALRQGRLLRSPTLFEDVVKVICTTNTTWAQTTSMVARIADAYGSPHQSMPDRKAFPTPQQIASDTLEGFSAKAKLGYRNASVYKIASDIAAGVLDLEELQTNELTSTDLYKRLLTLPGVGPYAASCLMIYLGRYDRVNVDSWARTLVGKELGRTVTDKEAHAFFEEYGEWKALVYHFYPWKEDEILVS